MRNKNICACLASAITLLSACSTVDHAQECDRYLAAAEDALTTKKYDQARELLKKADNEAEKSDNRLPALLVLRERAAVALAEGSFEEAANHARSLIDSYEQIISNESNSVKRTEFTEDQARASILLGDSLVGEKRAEDALNVYKSAQNKVGNAAGSLPLSAVLGAKIAGVARTLNRQDEESNIEDTFIHGGDCKYARDKAEALRKKGHLAEAVAAYQQAQLICCVQFFRYVDSTIELAATEYLMGRGTQARNDVSQVLKKMNDKEDPNASVHRIKCQVLLALTEPGGPSTAQIDELRANPAMAAIASGFATQLFYLTTGSPYGLPLAKFLWMMQGPETPILDRMNAVNQASVAFRREKRNLEAIDWFDEQLSVKGNSWITGVIRASCLEQLAKFLEESGYKEQAKEKKLAAIKLREMASGLRNDERVWNLSELRGDYEAVGETDKSISVALKAITDRSLRGTLRYPEIELALARTYAAEHETAKAVRLYDAAILDLKSVRSPDWEVASRERHALGP